MGWRDLHAEDPNEVWHFLEYSKSQVVAGYSKYEKAFSFPASSNRPILPIFAARTRKLRWSGTCQLPSLALIQLPVPQSQFGAPRGGRGGRLTFDSHPPPFTSSDVLPRPHAHLHAMLSS